MEDRGPGLQVCLIIVIILSVLAVSLRFVSRCLAGTKLPQRLWWDDWLALLCLVSLLHLP